jgi:hypothetical protein
VYLLSLLTLLHVYSDQCSVTKVLVGVTYTSISHCHIVSRIWINSSNEPLTLILWNISATGTIYSNPNDRWKIHTNVLHTSLAAGNLISLHIPLHIKPASLQKRY